LIFFRENINSKKNNFFVYSSSTEPTLICQNPIEESEQVASLPPLSLVNTQRSSSFSSDPLEVVNENLSDTQTAVESLSNSEPSNPTMVVITSPSFNSDLSSEQNDSIDSLNPSSTSFLQTKQRRITHRRNKSEPFKSASAEDLSSTTNNDSPLSNNAKDEIRRKSSTKMKPITQDKSPPSLTIRKKKAWYNVSGIYFFEHLYVLYICVFSFQRFNESVII
jgi:hypothetical protein